ncbi:MAG: EAL domain-containing protein [Sulfuritalea sp.]|nr:EAL domain-containing protein [Sulfuritalea sp.]
MNTSAIGTLQEQLEDLRDKLARDGWDRLRGLRLLHRLKLVHSLLENGAVKDTCAALVSLLSKAVTEKEIAAVRLHALLDLTGQLAVALGKGDLIRRLPSAVSLQVQVVAVGAFDQALGPLRLLLAGLGSTLVECPQPEDMPAPLGKRHLVLTDMEWVLSLKDAQRRSLAAEVGKAACWIALTDPAVNFSRQLELLRAGVRHFVEKPLVPQRLAAVIEESCVEQKGDRYRVMLVDDEQSALNAFSAVLVDAGMEVLPSEDPLLVLDFMDEFQPDVLVADIEMEACRGPELVTLIRQKERYAHLPVVYLTAWNDRDRQLAARRSAAEDFLPKSGDPAVLVASVETLARRYRSQRRTAADVAARDEDLNRALSVAQVGSWVLDFIRGEMHWSSEACRILGLPKESSLSLDDYLEKIVHEEDRAAVKQFRRAALKGELAVVEHRVVLGGDIRWVQSRAERIVDAAGNIVRYVGTVQDITERRRAELGQEHAKRALAQAIDGTPIPTFVIDADHRVTQWNHACELVLKIPAADMVGTRDAWKAFYQKPRPVLADLIVNDDRATMERYYADTIRLSTVVQGAYEAEGFFANTGRWLSFLASPLRDDTGRVVGAIETLQDVTERKQAEIALRGSQTLMASVLSSASYSIIATDPQGIITVFNSGAETLLGYAAEELIGKRDPGAFHDVDEVVAYAGMLTHELGFAVAPGFDAFVARTRVTGQPDEREWTYIRKDGRRVPVLLSVTAIRNPKGDIDGYLGVATSVEERKQAEANLRVAAIAFESQEGMMITDAKGVIVRVNQAFIRLTGYSAEEAIGQTPALFKSGRHDAAYYQRMWATLRESGYWQGEIWNRRKNGKIYAEMLTISSVVAPDGQVSNYIGTFSDISRNTEAEAEIHRLAFYDPLTQLPNRRLLLDRLQQAITASARNGREGALLFIDLDNFKTLNDTLGHDKGDLLLQQVAQRLNDSVREGDTVARLGGDEFVVMLEGLDTNPEDAAPQAKMVGEKILAALNEPYLLAQHKHHSTPSIGVTLFGGNQDTVDELLKRADFAMYQSKAAGRNTLRFFDPQMQAVVTARAGLEAEMRQALQHQQFLLYYQPQVDGAGKLTGVEALVRWKHPERGMVSPAEFIPLAEDSGLILPLGHWVLQTACSRLVSWASQPGMAHLTVAVNVSARQFHHVDFVEQVLAILEHTGADPRRLKLELTESLLLADVEDIIKKMTTLKANGVGFSLDDFGTGYSSLTYLKRLPLDQLKIDQSFVRDVLTDPNDAAIAKAIITLGQSLGLAVIAEGVETEGQRDFLASHGCNAYQGYLFGRPCAAADLAGATPPAPRPVS